MMSDARFGPSGGCEDSAYQHCPKQKRSSRVIPFMVAAVALCFGVQGCGGGTVYESLEAAQQEICVDLADPGQACLDFCLECIRGYHAAHKHTGQVFNQELVQRCGSTKVCPPAGYIPP
ncbi:unnamed protein product [Symbiodinium microadriaticum]|nr:unnamed protein product [Symbiodinium sp. KB8]CAE7459862.1 unnamed protein product [Symbiodinium microadriaticum]